MTDEIRDALREYAAPSTPPPGGAGRVLAALDRRRRRRTATVASATAVLALVVGVGVVVGAVRGDEQRAEGPSDRTSVAPDDTGAPARWVELAQAPLDPRRDSVGVWTGSEMVVVGGTTARPCGPGDCAAPAASTYLRDGAAYDPATDTWREIADAPSTFRFAQAVWSGEEMVVAADTGAWAYDPGTDGWRTLDPAPGFSVDPGVHAPPVVVDGGIVFPSYDQQSGGTSPDLLLDPESGTWSRLPRDPFGESYDRSVAWDGTRLWLLSMAVENHGAASEGARSRLAVLEDGLAGGTWRVVDDETPPFVYGQVLSWTGERLVVGPLDGQYGFTVDVAARKGRSGSMGSRWTETGPLRREVEGCALPTVGTGSAWVAGGGPVLVAARGSNDWAVVPDCPRLSAPDVAVWAGNDLLVWGGPSADQSAGTAIGYRSEPEEPATAADGPCPATLPLAPRDTYGLGTTRDATAEPDLPVPEEAWVCRYGSQDIRPDNSGGAWYEWTLDGGPEPVADLDALAAELDEVHVADRTPEPGMEYGITCAGTGGPRFLVAYRAGDRLVGVAVDPSACGEVRLTDDPYEVVVGQSEVPGIVAGVLQAPPALSDRVRAAFP